jgi:hypothetical protein
MAKVQYFLKVRDMETLEAVMKDPTFTEYLRGYSAFLQGVSSGSLGKTAQFRLTYILFVHRSRVVGIVPPSGCKDK